MKLRVVIKALFARLRCPASAGVDGAPWHLPTAATRSARFICRRQRSHRSPKASALPK